jgi:hypothetical protein
MVILDRIRLTGLLTESPASAGLSHLVNAPDPLICSMRSGLHFPADSSVEAVSEPKYRLL